MRTRKQLVAAIEREKRIIAKSRDTLRGLVDDVHELTENADEAIDNLENAADALSRTL